MAQVKYLVGRPLYDPFYVFEDAIRGVLSPATTSEFTAGQAPGRSVVFKGSFTVAAGEVTGGTMTGFEVFLGNTKVAVGSGFSVDGADIFNAIRNDIDDEVFELLFNAGPVKFNGSALDDYWEGGSFGDKLNGKDGSDSLWGWDGDDNIKGGDGSDFLTGGAGFDTVRGGPGKDVFNFEITDFPAEDHDTIKDFKPGEDLFSLYDLTLDIPPGFLDKDFFRKGKSAGDADDIVIYDKKSGKIYVDTDGTGTDVQYLLAEVKAGTKLGADDFWIIPGLLF